MFKNIAVRAVGLPVVLLLASGLGGCAKREPTRFPWSKIPSAPAIEAPALTAAQQAVVVEEPTTEWQECLGLPRAPKIASAEYDAFWRQIEEQAPFLAPYRSWAHERATQVVVRSDFPSLIRQIRGFPRRFFIRAATRFLGLPLAGNATDVRRMAALLPAQDETPCGSLMTWWMIVRSVSVIDPNFEIDGLGPIGNVAHALEAARAPDSSPNAVRVSRGFVGIQWKHWSDGARTAEVLRRVVSEAPAPVSVGIDLRGASGDDLESLNAWKNQLLPYLREHRVPTWIWVDRETRGVPEWAARFFEGVTRANPHWLAVSVGEPTAGFPISRCEVPLQRPVGGIRLKIHGPCTGDSRWVPGQAMTPDLLFPSDPVVSERDFTRLTERSKVALRLQQSDMPVPQDISIQWELGSHRLDYRDLAMRPGLRERFGDQSAHMRWIDGILERWRRSAGRGAFPVPGQLATPSLEYGWRRAASPQVGRSAEPQR